MKSDLVNIYRIKPGLAVAFVITLMTFGVIAQDAPLWLLFIMAGARFSYLLGIWLLYFPVSKRFQHKLLSLFIYLMVCMVAILPLVYYNLWVNEVANVFYPPFESPAHIKNLPEFLTFYYLSRAVGMGLLLFPIQYREDLVRDKQFYLLANEKLRNQNLLHQLESLKQQLDPHFLFNTLNALKTLISVDPARAEKYAVEISDVYRYLLQHNRNKTVLLQEEFNFLHSYLSLLKLRFEDNLQVSVTIDQALYGKSIFPLSLQLLLENAVKHNVVTKDFPLHVRIYSKENSIVVENKIKLRTTTDGVSQYGLAHLSKLYQLHYNQEIDITNTSTIFSVSLPLN
jgi:two-component system LytT family sensor kinase